MQTGVRNALAALLMVCLLAGCKGTITSPAPLISPANATYPFRPAAAVEALSLNDDNVWEQLEGTARLTLQDRSYRLTEPGKSTPSPDTYLLSKSGTACSSCRQAMARNGHTA